MQENKAVHIYRDIWLDADKWGFHFFYKGIYEKGKHKGNEKRDYFSSHSTVDQVAQKLKALGIYDQCNRDIVTAIEYFDKAIENLKEGLPELQKKRYSYRK